MRCGEKRCEEDPCRSPATLTELTNSQWGVQSPSPASKLARRFQLEDAAAAARPHCFDAAGRGSGLGSSSAACGGVETDPVRLLWCHEALREPSGRP